MSLLESTALRVDKDVARDALRAYREHIAAATDEDRAIMTAYREIARGRMVVQAIQAIRVAGRFESGLPKLAMTRADVGRVYCTTWPETVDFSAATPRGWSSKLAPLRVSGLPRTTRCDSGTAIVPLIPLPLRPKAKLANYWILWEADWHRAPSDPLLLRRLKGDLWLVLAAWDLTAIERAVLEQRVSAA